MQKRETGRRAKASPSRGDSLEVQGLPHDEVGGVAGDGTAAGLMIFDLINPSSRPSLCTTTTILAADRDLLCATLLALTCQSYVSLWILTPRTA